MRAHAPQGWPQTPPPPHPHPPTPSACSDRPACERDGEREGRLLRCNVRLQAESMQRLVHRVDAALLRWAEHTGQHEALQPLLGPLLQRERQRQRRRAAAGAQIG